MKSQARRIVYAAITFLCIFLIITCIKVEKKVMVSTGSVSNIEKNSAKAEGTLVDIGEGVTDHGHVYSTSKDVTMSGTKVALGSKGTTGSFTSELNNLTAGTTYYIRAYVTGNSGTQLGKEISFKTVDPVVPSVTTAAVSGITTSKAVSGGDVTSDGGAEVSAKGVCWGTSSEPSVSGNKTADGTGIGLFTSNLEGLADATTYYIRAYATNAAGTGYGSEISFSTVAIVPPTVTTEAASHISSSYAQGGGNVTSDGGSPILAKGVCWSKNPNPTTSDPKTDDGTGTGGFGNSMGPLEPATLYHVRAYATNLKGTAYGEDLTFTTLAGLPVVFTVEVTGVTGTGAISGGNITNDGGSAILTRGVCWNTSGSPTTDGAKTAEGTGAGIFSSTLTGLSINTKYYVRAYATNSAGLSYGEELIFTTSSATFATVSTSAISNPSKTTASGGGNITSDGGSSVTARGICWSLNQNPTLSDSHTTDDFGTGFFSSQMTGLLPGRTYYVKAYATNGTGTAYGPQVSFITASDIPTVTTSAPPTITATTADPGGEVTDNNGSTTTTRGVCYNTIGSPTISDSKLSESGGLGTFKMTLTGLTPLTTYYARAFAVNSIGTAYGVQVQFTTPAAPAAISTTSVTGLASTSVVSGGNVTSDGGTAINIRGVCWSTSSNPTIALATKTTDGSGIGAFISRVPNLTPSTTYFLRAYATNTSGITFYGSEVTFTTTIQVSDGEGNNYNTVKIGDQLWMQENLKVTKYRDGTSIKYLTDNTAWDNDADGAYCWYGNNSTNGATYGALYNYYATINGLKLCPTGWHVATDDEYITMETYLIANGFNYDDAISGNKLGKALASTSTWNSSSNTGAVGNSDYPLKRNVTGFTAIPGGYRVNSGLYYTMLLDANFWTSSSASATSGYKRQIDYNTNFETRATGNLNDGYSVRCIQGEGKVLPVVTTTAISGKTATGASSGGNVTSDGGVSVTAKGVCWSTSPGPTADLATKTIDGTGTGTYTSTITGLTANTTYYVRAYATNSVGTAYGNEQSFTSNSTVPDAPTIGTATAGNMQASVTFTAPASDGGSAITGYTVISNDFKTGTGTTSPITVTGLNNLQAYTFTVVATNINGNSAPSAASNSVIPGTVISANSRIWMDRNLGASQVATSSTDAASYGYYYQWGRLTDDHQISFSGTSINLSSSDTPGHGSFILTANNPYDWRSPQNDNLWQGVSGTNNPCPSGYRLPTEAEWNAERLSWSANNATGAFASPLKLPMTGYRQYNNGSFSGVGSKGYYWSSTVSSYFSITMYFDSSSATNLTHTRANGTSVRCIKD